MTIVKFCGMTREQDVEAACALGVNALGFVLWPGSPRAVTIARLAALIREIPASVLPVGVFVDPADEDLARAIDAGVRVVQIHGARAHTFRRPCGDGRSVRETDAAWSRAACWLATSLEEGVPPLDEDDVLVLDAHDPVRHGGTGTPIDWTRAAQIARQRRIVLAGGLTPANVTEAIASVRPYGVDVASGIEDGPGVKSARAMRAFVAAVREGNR